MSKLFPSIATMYHNINRLAIGYGQWRSIRERKAIDAFGEPIPWYTYPAIEYLRSFDFKECDVFEFGAGNSSVFWARRSRSIISVENNADWFHYVNNCTQNNQLVIHRSLESDYVGSLSEQCKLFQIIVIDGQWRDQCVREAIKYLAKGGMILLDNSDRIIEKESSKILRDQGFFQIDFSGFGPINGYSWTTSIFMKVPILLQQGFVGPTPIGGLKY